MSNSGLLGALRRWLAPAPAPATGVFTDCRWLPALQNPYGIDVLDIAPAVRALRSSGASEAQQARALGWTTDDGHALASVPSPANTVELPPGTLSWPADPLLADGALFRPQALEEKWALFLRDGRLLLVKSWSGELAVAIDVERQGEELVATAIHGDPTGGLCPDEGWRVRVCDFLVQSHALGRILPAPLLPGLPQDDVEQLVLWSFRTYGRRALALSAEAPSLPPPAPLRADTALHIAALAGRADLVLGALEAGHDLRTPGSFQGYTALHVGAAMGHETVCMVLLSRGAPVDLRSAPTGEHPDGQTPLQVCCMQHKAGQDAVAGLLLAAGADPRIRAPDGATPLHFAARAGQLGVATQLLVAGADPSAADSAGHTALHIAAELGQEGLIDALLRAGARADAADHDGTTPAQLARHRGHEALAHRLDREA